MIKRLISFVSALILLLMISAHADTKRMQGNFTIRNGITYRMPKDEIISAERAYGNQKEPLSRGLCIWDDDAPDGTVTISTLRFEGFPLLGETHKRCALGYCLDEKEQLIGMYQCIIGGDDGYTYFKTDAKSDYSRIRSDLIAKYGPPIGELTNGNGTLLTAHTHAYIDADISDVYGTTSTCSQWLVQYDDCYCIIELFIREGNSALQTRGMVNSVYLAYRFVTATELDELMQDAQQRKNEQYRDI